VETKPPNDLNWLLNDFVNRTNGALGALVTSRDGIRIASLNFEETRTEDGKDATADTLSAVASGLHSLAIGAVPLLGNAGGVRQVVVELDKGHLFVMAAGDGSLLSVLVDEQADVGLVAYEMTLLIKGVRAYLHVGPRSEPAPPSAPTQ
jgi:predicted regulator of Ras-like GTPase activity (Roadblock/LC7/MglB family)